MSLLYQKQHNNINQDGLSLSLSLFLSLILTAIFQVNLG